MATDPEENLQPREESLIGRVANAARELRDAEDRHRVSASALADALLAAHDGGFSWSEVARAADLGSAETARIRALRAKETHDLPAALRWRRERGSAPRPASILPGVSVTEAARRLSVSRNTVYSWIQSGKLTSTTDDSGRTRVLLDEA